MDTTGRSQKIAVLGGTGRAGKYIVNELIRQHLPAKLLVRNPLKAPQHNPLIEIVTGSAKNYSAIQRLLSDCQAVISALGPRDSESNINSIAASHVIKVMQQLKINRYIEIAGLAIDVPGDKKRLKTKLIAKLIRMFAAEKANDRQKVYQILRASDINWTIVRCPMIELSDTHRTIKLSLEDSPGNKVSAQDLSAFIVGQLSDEQFYRKCPFIAS